MMKDFFDGIFNYLRVFLTATRYGLWKYLFFSGLLSMIIGTILLYGAYRLGGNLGEGLFNWYKWEFGSNVIEKIDNWIGVLLIIILAISIFKYLILIIASPFMSFASEQLERQMSAYPPHKSFTVSQALSDLKRGLTLNLRNLIRELGFVFLLLILGFIPVITIFIPILIFLVQSFYAGFGNLDYFLERHFDVKGAVAFSKKHRLLAVGNGMVFLFLLMIPFLGWFIAPFFATISGTLAGVKRV